MGVAWPIEHPHVRFGLTKAVQFEWQPLAQPGLIPNGEFGADTGHRRFGWLAPKVALRPDASPITERPHKGGRKSSVQQRLDDFREGHYEIANVWAKPNRRRMAAWPGHRRSARV